MLVLRLLMLVLRASTTPTDASTAPTDASTTTTTSERERVRERAREQTSEREKESECTCSRARERERERGRQREGLSVCVREDESTGNMQLTSELAQIPIVADYDPKQKQYVWDYAAVRYCSKGGGESLQQYVLGGRESVGGVMHTHPPHV